ncbi:MAG: hypothetical protein WAO52_15255, partial [Prolixibacteraceae bacterium]
TYFCGNAAVAMDRIIRRKNNFFMRLVFLFACLKIARKYQETISIFSERNRSKTVNCTSKYIYTDS